MDAGRGLCLAGGGCGVLVDVRWTNTMPNLPAWGAREAVVGNHPLVMGVPRAGGEHVVLDMAMSQYSYGALAVPPRSSAGQKRQEFESYE